MITECSPVATSSRAIWSSSAPGAVEIVNNTPVPPGRMSGQTCTAFSGAVIASGSPPAADTLRRPLKDAVPNTIMSSAPQLAPLRFPGSSEIVTGGPPSVETFCKVPPAPAMNPIHAPSGDMKG